MHTNILFDLLLSRIGTKFHQLAASFEQDLIYEFEDLHWLLVHKVGQKLRRLS